MVYSKGQFTEITKKHQTRMVSMAGIETGALQCIVTGPPGIFSWFDFNLCKQSEFV